MYIYSYCEISFFFLKTSYTLQPKEYFRIQYTKKIIR